MSEEKGQEKKEECCGNDCSCKKDRSLLVVYKNVKGMPKRMAAEACGYIKELLEDTDAVKQKYDVIVFPTRNKNTKVEVPGLPTIVTSEQMEEDINEKKEALGQLITEISEDDG